MASRSRVHWFERVLILMLVGSANAIEVLLVHRGDDRHALDAELPPIVEWP